MSNTTICLNMIVKNESHIIEQTLNNIIDNIKIDYWVICDTGSTDNTPQIITEFFEKKGRIPIKTGKLPVGRKTIDESTANRADRR